jgi:hypothetical protein
MVVIYDGRQLNDEEEGHQLNKRHGVADDPGSSSQLCSITPATSHPNKTRRGNRTTSISRSYRITTGTKPTTTRRMM